MRVTVRALRCKVKGAHVLVRRGGCSFLAKALSVSNSGGHSLIVVDEGAGRLRMEMEEGEHVNIPVVMVSKLDGERLSPPAEKNNCVEYDSVRSYQV